MIHTYPRKVVVLFILSICLTTLTTAQVRVSKQQTAIAVNPAVSVTEMTPVASATPLLPNSDSELRGTFSPLVPYAPVTSKLIEQVQDDGLGSLMGTTYYDFQTNACMPNRLTYFDSFGDKVVQLVWMANHDSTRGDATTRAPGFNPNRGGRYNYVNVTDPDDPQVGIENWKKLESGPDRGGWPSAVQFTEGELGTTSHVPVKFYINGGPTSDEFQKTVVDPTTLADSAAWPRAAIGTQPDGRNIIHLIYNRTVSTTPTFVAQTMYQRSTNNGSSWETPIPFTGTGTPVGNLLNGWGGDTYAIAARGTHVSVILYTNYNTILWQSHDNGVNWRARLAFGSLTVKIDSTDRADGSKRVITDTALGALPSMDVIIDHDGNTHWVVAGSPTYFTYTYPAGGGNRADTIGILNGRGDMRYGQLVYGNTVDTTHVFPMGPVAGGSWDGEGSIVNRRSDNGCRWPQLGMDASGGIFCLYGSMKNGDLKEVVVDTTPEYTNDVVDTLVTVNALQMHVYGTQMYKPASGKYEAPYIVWSTPKDLSPVGINSQYASLCDDVVNDRLYYAYSTSVNPGDRVTNVNMPAELATIYMRALPTSALNVPLDVPAEQVLKADVTLAPNPSDEVSRVTISGVTNGAILVSLASYLGEIVMQTSTQPFGERAEIQIPTRSLASGAYTVTIQQNGRRITKTLSVIH